MAKKSSFILHHRLFFSGILFNESFLECSTILPSLIQEDQANNYKQQQNHNPKCHIPFERSCDDPEMKKNEENQGEGNGEEKQD
jgi:hypothetical protein